MGGVSKLWWPCPDWNRGHYGYELSKFHTYFSNKSKIDNIVKDILGRSEIRLCDLLRLFLLVMTQEQPKRK
jgi:hypothetical protein